MVTSQYLKEATDSDQVYLVSSCNIPNIKVALDSTIRLTLGSYKPQWIPKCRQGTLHKDKTTLASNCNLIKLASPLKTKAKMWCRTKKIYKEMLIKLIKEITELESSPIHMSLKASCDQ